MNKRSMRTATLRVAGLPRLNWKVEVSADCPRCGDEMNLGSSRDGGSILVCTSCTHELHPVGAYKAVFQEALVQLADRGR